MMKRRNKNFNRDEGQYKLTHIFDEFLVPTRFITDWELAIQLLLKKQHRQKSTPVVHLVLGKLRKVVTSIETYTLSGFFNWLRIKEHWTYFYLPILINPFNQM